MPGISTDYFYEVMTYDANSKGTLTLPRLMDYLGDAAIKQSEKLGVGFEYLLQNNYAWVLFKWDIKVKRYPKVEEKLKLTTTPYSFKKFYAFRVFSLIDEKGEEVATAVSLWMLIDYEKRKTVKIPEDFYKYYGIDENENEKLEIKKIQRISSFDYEKIFNVRYSDIDFNNHVNNVNYVSWILETIPKNIMDGYSVEELRITYEKEALLGEQVKVQTEIVEEEGKFIGKHKILNSEEELLTISETIWKRC